MAHRIIARRQLCDDDATNTYIVCVETEKGRAHLEFTTSGYDTDGDPFKDPRLCITSRIILSLCNCEVRSGKTPAWMTAVTDVYLQHRDGQTIEARRAGGRVIDAVRAVWVWCAGKGTAS